MSEPVRQAAALHDVQLIFEWHKRFSEGREVVKDDERPGRPSTSRTEEENVEKISQTVRKDRRLSVRMIAESVNTDKDTAWKILREDLTMKRVCAKMVPRVLTPEQKERRKEYCVGSLQKLISSTPPGSGKEDSSNVLKAFIAKMYPLPGHSLHKVMSDNLLAFNHPED
ncbi:protein GVQW3-like [Macrobrachium rosenbergii]|uniref:protein GVQW3-like n=1 Tax=Macrobrachium rosenbergii TaxID=79674 RepID=UPI0034D3B53A